MQNKLAVNVFEGEQTPSTNNESPKPSDTQTQQQQTGQEQTFDKKPLVSTTGQDQSQETNMISYVPWVAAGIVTAVILVALLIIIRKLNKKK